MNLNSKKSPGSKLVSLLIWKMYVSELLRYWLAMMTVAFKGLFLMVTMDVELTISWTMRLLGWSTCTPNAEAEVSKLGFTSPDKITMILPDKDCCRFKQSYTYFLGKTLVFISGSTFPDTLHCTLFERKPSGKMNLRVELLG